MGVLDIVQAVTATGGWACLLLLVSLWRTAGWFAVANGALLVADVVRGGHLVEALLAAVVCAWDVWIWWNGGGGGGTRRRLRALRGVFRGVRRTAPVAGGAS